MHLVLLVVCVARAPPTPDNAVGGVRRNTAPAHSMKLHPSASLASAAFPEELLSRLRVHVASAASTTGEFWGHRCGNDGQYPMWSVPAAATTGSIQSHPTGSFQSHNNRLFSEPPTSSRGRRMPSGVTKYKFSNWNSFTQSYQPTCMLLTC